jgi:phenylacetate-CoA ligase
MNPSLENLLRNTKPLRRLYAAAPPLMRNFLLNLRARPLARLRYSGNSMAKLEQLLARDEWSRDELTAYVQGQRERWAVLAMQSPYYYENSQGVATTCDFPVLTREEARRSAVRLCTSSASRAIRVFTSGTSGSGMPVWWDPVAYAWNWAYEMKHKHWAGVNPRAWRVTFYGAQVIPLSQRRPPFWMLNKPERQVLMSIFHATEENARAYVDFLESQQGRILEGFPTVLWQIARFVRALKGSLQFQAVFSTGEPLLPFMRADIEDAFGAKAYDHYGMTEFAGLVLECERGGYHALLDYGDLEILGKDGEHLPPGEEGDLVWTGFLNPAMPFIRYRIGDRGLWEGRPCPCGRPYPLVQPTLTRDSDYLSTPSGQLYSPRAINQVLKDKVSFVACQFVQCIPEEIIIRVVPDHQQDFRPELEEVKRALQRIVGSEMRIREEVADAPLRRGNQGKIPLILSQLVAPHSQGPTSC